MKKFRMVLKFTLGLPVLLLLTVMVLLCAPVVWVICGMKFSESCETIKEFWEG